MFEARFRWQLFMRLNEFQEVEPEERRRGKNHLKAYKAKHRKIYYQDRFLTSTVSPLLFIIVLLFWEPFYTRGPR